MILSRDPHPASSLRFVQIFAKLIMQSAIIVRLSVCYYSLVRVTILCIRVPNHRPAHRPRGQGQPPEVPALPILCHTVRGGSLPWPTHSPAGRGGPSVASLGVWSQGSTLPMALSCRSGTVSCRC